MKILKYLLILIVILVTGFIIFIAMQPNTYHMFRSAEINAPYAVVYDYIDDYTKSYHWSPWLYREPGAEITYGEKTYGTDAWYSWKGDMLGEGNIKTIYASKDSISRILTFIKPYESVADVYWYIEDLGSTTKATWGMRGKMGFMDKITAVFNGGIDKTAGPDYERGLRRLDSVVNNHMKKYSISDDGVVAHEGSYYLYINASAKQNEAAGKIKQMLSALKTFANYNNIEITGMPFTMHQDRDEETATTLFSVSLPVKEKIMTSEGSKVLCSYMKPQRYYKTSLKGDYSHLKEAWEKAMEFMQAAGVEALGEGGTSFEVYANDPAEYPNPADWTTGIYIPVK